jgi:hypothetical protein
MKQWRRKRDSIALNPLILSKLLTLQFARFAEFPPNDDFGCFDVQTRHSESPSSISPPNQFYELAQNENGQYATSAAAHPETAYRRAPRIADVHAAVFDFQLQIVASLTPISRISPGPCARLRTASTSPMICSSVDSTASLWDIDSKDHPRTI